MICEMCGKNVPSTRPTYIEGSKLDVCPNCARFGEGAGSNVKSVTGSNAHIIEERLEKRNRRMKTKDVYEGKDTVQIIDDYGGAIKKARSARGLTLEEFALSIGEKKGILAKVESNSLTPDDKLVKKIEKALEIELTEVVRGGGVIGKNSGNDKMTLANFIKKE